MNSKVPAYKKLSPHAAIHFSPHTGHIAMQVLGSLDDLYETVDETEAKFSKLGEVLEQHTGGRFFLGPVKDRPVAEEKVARDYEGKAKLISDIVRGKDEVDSAEAISLLREIMNPATEEPHEILKKFGIRCLQLTDYYAEPKFETGYRALFAKLAIPLDPAEEEISEALENGLSIEDLDKKYHIVELQVVHKDLEAIYAKTHSHMRQAQNIAAKYRNELIPNNEAYRMAAHYDVCKFENGCTSRKAGLDDLLHNKNNALTEEEAKSLKRTIHMHRFDY